MGIAVEVQHVGKRYGRKPALEDVCFRVPAGASLGLVGPNGAGKSTLLRTLLGLVPPTSGTIRYDRHPLWPDPERAMARVGGFVDMPCFYPYLTAQENLLLLADLTGTPRNRTEEVLDYVHLRSYADERVGGFSHGMRQRLGIAVALMKNPSLLVLDEPYDGLDPARLEDMRRLIEAIRRDTGATLVLSSHVMQDIERLCDFIAVFEAGRLRYFGSPTLLGAGSVEEVLWEIWPVDPALEYLTQMGIPARVLGPGRVSAAWTGDWDLSEVNRFLVRRGLALTTVVRRQASLETRLVRYLEDSHVDVR